MITRLPLILVAVLVLAGRQLPVSAGAPSRDALWREIFRRPPPVSSGLPDRVEDARRTLGGRLFYDVRLSGDDSRSCASCHVPGLGFTNGERRGRARDGSDLSRNVPHLWNLAWAPALFWDGRAASLEAQAEGPIEDPREMAGHLETSARVLSTDPEVAAQFAAAFPGPDAVSPQNIVSALAAYERSLVSPETRFDRWVAGDETALDAREHDGFRLFTGKGGCVACHGGWRFTDDGFHDIGLRSPDPGRGAVSGGVAGLRAFKTPGLRDVTRTAPYMHDGSLASLSDVLDHYGGGLERRPGLAASLPPRLAWTPAEKEALIAFLRTLSPD